VHLKDITGTLGSELRGKKIALCVTGSVSITEAPRIARLLMRHGAEVIPLLTPKAAEFVSPMIFEWSTGNPPITKLSGRVEHVELVSPPSKVDLVLVAPCTANTLAKISSGICDEPVSTLCCTAIGARIPILIATAMHEPMTRNPMIEEAKAKLGKLGVRFVEGRVVESKSKLAQPEEIANEVISMLVQDQNSSPIPPPSHSSLPQSPTASFEKVSFLITAGATREPIDDVRFISNRSSGKMGVALAEEALSKGARNICLIHGPAVEIPESLKIDASKRVRLESVETSKEMLDLVVSNLSRDSYDVLISAAAPADYSPVSPARGKIRTSERRTLSIQLEATKKIIEVAKEKFPNVFVVAFKAEHGANEQELIARASEMLDKGVADMVVANDVSRREIGFGSEFNEVFVVTRKEGVKHLPKAPKREIAKEILEIISEEIGVKKNK
jgi:phosphopantothenoylcysteine decarboxylase/phosphopantothenate--cysteine ligase